MISPELTHFPCAKITIGEIVALHSAFGDLVYLDSILIANAITCRVRLILLCWGNLATLSAPQEM